MSLESGIFEMVTGVPGVGALIGSRLYPNFVPDDVAHPAGSYQIISRSSFKAHDGRVQLSRLLVQVNLFGKRYVELLAAITSMEKTLQGFRGEAGGERFDEVQFSEGPGDYDEETEYHQVIGELLMIWRQGE